MRVTGNLRYNGLAPANITGGITLIENSQVAILERRCVFVHVTFVCPKATINLSRENATLLEGRLPLASLTKVYSKMLKG